MKRLFLLLLLSVVSGVVLASEQIVPTFIEAKVSIFYKYRADGEAGREVLLSYSGGERFSKCSVEVVSKWGSETSDISVSDPGSISLLLPPKVGQEQDDTVTITLVNGKERLSQRLVVPKMRQWRVFVYPHSHVDIGYTNTQANVEFIHKRNLDVAIELAEKTADYPEGAKFKWNAEVVWPIERYLNSESKEQCDRLLEAISKGQICVDGGYINTNTTACNEEELLELMKYGKQIEAVTGQSVETIVQVDIPGVSWGVVKAAAEMGLKYFISPFNGDGRVGNGYDLNFKPFWWQADDGVSKILFLQPASYAPGAQIKGHMYWPKLAGQTDRSKLMRVVESDDPRANFVDKYLLETLPMLEQRSDYPYEIFPMTWCMADNTPVDIDLPEAVKSWNEEYAYPQLQICSATEMMQAYDREYGDQIPTLSGDYTEYWTDGLGSSARHPGRSREVKEELIQAEILWSMLEPKGTPRETIHEAWRNILLSTEHTWAYMQPEQQPICDEILGVKFGYFDNADLLMQEVYGDVVSKIESREGDYLAVINTNSWSQSSIVTVAKEQFEGYNAIEDDNGEAVTIQYLSSGDVAFEACSVPSFGVRNYKLLTLSSKELKRREAEESGHSTVAASYIDNGLVRVELDQLSGDVKSIIYKGEEYVNGVDQSAVNSYRYLKGGYPASSATGAYNVSIEVGEQGEFINSLIVRSDAEGCRSLTREVILKSGSPVVEFNNIVDKEAILEKEGVHFGFAFDVDSARTRVNIPFGVMEVERDQLKAGNRNWITKQRWLDLSNGEKGISWCSMNAPMFEYGDMSANVLGMATKSPEWIRELKPSSTIYSWAMNNHWFTNFPLSQEGEVTFRYRVMPHDSGFDVASANRFGLEQFRPLVVTKVEKPLSMPNRLLFSGDDKLFVSNYKSIDGGREAIVRLVSYSQSDEKVSLSWEKRSPKAYILSNGLNEDIERVADFSQVVVPASGVVTLKVVW